MNHGRGTKSDAAHPRVLRHVPRQRNHPIRVIPVTFFIWALLTLISFFVVRDKMSAAIMASLININLFAFGVALGAVTVELCPREKIGQFCSAQAFFYSTTIMVRLAEVQPRRVSLVGIFLPPGRDCHREGLSELETKTGKNRITSSMKLIGTQYYRSRPMQFAVNTAKLWKIENTTAENSK